MSDELKPCPFCGSKAVRSEIHYAGPELFSCSNPDCDLGATNYMDTFASDSESWNHRPIEDALRSASAMDGITKVHEILSHLEKVAEASRCYSALGVLYTRLEPPNFAGSIHRAAVEITKLCGRFLQGRSH